MLILNNIKTHSIARLHPGATLHTVRRMTVKTQAISGIITRTLLLLSLLLAGLVPSGMMRQAGADGMRLVLCTADGVQEVWLSENGDTTPVDPDGDASKGHKPHCVQVNLIAQSEAIPSVHAPANQAVPLAAPPITHQVLSRQFTWDIQRTRAPPALT